MIVASNSKTQNIVDSRNHAKQQLDVEFRDKQQQLVTAYNTRSAFISSNAEQAINSQENTRTILEDEKARITTEEEEFLIVPRAHQEVARSGIILCQYAVKPKKDLKVYEDKKTEHHKMQALWNKAKKENKSSILQVEILGERLGASNMHTD